MRLDQAFTGQDAALIGPMATSDHLEATPYFRKVLTIARQIETLDAFMARLFYLTGEMVDLRGDSAAVSRFEKSHEGIFMAEALPARVFLSLESIKMAPSAERFWESNGLSYCLLRLVADKNNIGDNDGACIEKRIWCNPLFELKLDEQIERRFRRLPSYCRPLRSSFWSSFVPSLLTMPNMSSPVDLKVIVSKLRKKRLGGTV